MSTTDTSERVLESLIVSALTGRASDGSTAAQTGEGALPYSPPGYVEGSSEDYDRDHAVDLAKLLSFLKDTQPEAVEALNLDGEGASRQQFLHRLQGEIAKRGVIDMLRKGVKHGPASVDMFYGAPTPGNAKATEQYEANVFSVTRQLHYSKDETRLALDLAIFINGLPIATFELKNRLTKQTAHDAITQYERDRDPKELLFQFGRCVVHFAVDDREVWMCTHLQGRASWFLPFNKGHNDGAGNPPNPDGLATDYLWTELLKKDNLTNILEDYAQIVEEPGEKGRRKKRKQIFPRYHQLDVVRMLLADARAKGAGQRCLIQHSAGSGKSNSIAWLAHQLVELKRNAKPVFDSIIVVTDRRLLDKQIRDTIKQFAQASAVVGAVTQGSVQLRQFIQQGKKIIISTVQKFPFILDEIGSQHKGRSFAIIIDEAHSSQGGRTTAAMHAVLSGSGEDEEETTEDKINRMMESRKMLPNASYFAFTATPKNKTLELFGIEQSDGTFRPFHPYTMKQAIQEKFILDVLKHYTPVRSWYQIVKTAEDDPAFDAKKAMRKLWRYVESHDHAIRRKAEIMVDHFHDHVAKVKIAGKARAMVVTDGIRRAVQYKRAFDAYLAERKSPYRAIVAFSGEHEYGGEKLTEASMNGFPSAKIPEVFAAEEVKGVRGKDPYRFLIVADKFQTGYDEPLLHTMYVDKVLSGVKAVQTLSRLNRADPRKHDTFVLDFMNDSDTMLMAFEPYYRTTVLSESTDPNRLHDLKAELDRSQVYAEADVEQLVGLYVNGADRDRLDPILDRCVATYGVDLDENDQVAFKGKAKGFVRTYNFLAAVLPYSKREWEVLSIFLNFLVPKLPAPQEEDLSKGILETIDMDSYRHEVKAQRTILLPDKDGEVDPVPPGGGGGKPEPELDLLSNIIKAFNDLFGDVEWHDADKIHKVITEEIPARVSADKAFQNAKANSDKQNARIEHDKALQRVMMALLADHTELFKQFSDDPNFKKWLADTVFSLTYEGDVA